MPFARRHLLGVRFAHSGQLSAIKSRRNLPATHNGDVAQWTTAGCLPATLNKLKAGNAPAFAVTRDTFWRADSCGPH
jgi:hypothetical protein